MACFLWGGAFLCVGDFVSRVLVPGIEFPVGVITSLVGGVFLLRMIPRRLA